MINVIDYTERHKEFVDANKVDINENEIIVAEVDDFPVGILSYVPEDGGIEITSLGVMSNYHRQGVGSSMMAFLKLRNPHTEIIAISKEENHAFMNFLLKCDFELTHRLDSCYWFHYTQQDVPVLDLTNRISKHYG